MINGSESPNAELPQVRRDRFGNRIILTHDFELPKRRTRHQIVFRDEFVEGETITDINLVESYKKYNAMMAEDDPACSCNCAIFWDGGGYHIYNEHVVISANNIEVLMIEIL